MPDHDADDLDGRPIGRRAFLGVVGVGLSSLLWGDKALQGLSRATSGLPSAVRSAVPVGGQWRIYAVNPPYPRFDTRSWQLTVAGLVDRPLTLDTDELRALPRAEQTSDFHCVTGWSVTGVRWAGVRFADVLALVGPRPEAGALKFVSLERPYVDSLTLDQVRVRDALLAYEMDGEPLTREHGAPVRVVMPQMYGYKGVKWLDRIELVPTAQDGYWEQRGYDRDAWVGGSNGA